MREKSSSRILLGLVIAIIGILLGFYVGIWWGLIGGIVGVVESIRAGIPDATGFALYILRIMFATTIGPVVGYLVVIMGAIIGDFYD